jgi:hypothetical protein
MKRARCFSGSHSSTERFAGGIYCDENAVVRRDGSGIEQEADEFAAAVLMPFHDFRRQLPAKDRADFEVLGRLAKRYGSPSPLFRAPHSNF